MSMSNQATNIIGAATGTAGLSSPLWFDWLPPVWQGFVAVLGAVVLLLTIWKLWGDLELQRMTKRKMNEGK